LREERETKTSLEQRALAVIGASGALVTLAFGFVALIQPAVTAHTKPMIDARLLAVGLFMFVLASVCALIVSMPGKYAEANLEDLSKLTNENIWGYGDPILGARRVAELQVTLIERARKANRIKSRLLVGAISLVIAAVTVLGTSAYLAFASATL
jgi:Ca2+/Na+ antiporter